MWSRGFNRTLLQLTPILTALFLLAPLFAHESRGADAQVIARAEAVRRPATVDCTKIKAPQKARRSRPRVTDSLVQVGTPVKLNDGSAPDVITAGVWSPSGDSIAFVAFSGRWLPMNDAEDSAAQADPQNAPTRAVARSVNEIWLYRFTDKAWSKVTDDGARPRFSKDGKRLFFMSSSEGARAVDLATMAEESLGVPEAGDPHKRFLTEVLSDGTILTTGESDTILKQRNALSSTWAPIELAPNDEVRVAPDEEHIAVLYNATENNPHSALVVYDKAGTATTVLKNCPVPAIYSTWSQDGNSLVYPMTATGQPEVWETKLGGGSPLTRLRLHPSERINDVSLSPNNEIAFSAIGQSGRGWIWIANDKAMQRVTAGVLGKWSLQGDRILYATMRAQGEFDWYVLPVTVQSK